jgi:hypothetical protein
MPSIADDVATDLITVRSRTLRPRRYGFVAESFVLIDQVYQQICEVRSYRPQACARNGVFKHFVAERFHQALAYLAPSFTSIAASCSIRTSHGAVPVHHAKCGTSAAMKA